MPIRKPKPTSPGRRFATYPDFAEITKTEPEKSLVEGLRSPAGATPTAARPPATAAAAPSALYRKIDFKRRKDGVPGQASPRSSTTRTARRTSRCCTTSTARRRYILAPARLRVGDDRDVRARRGDRGRQLPAAARHADRHRGPQRRAAARPRRPDRPLGRHVDPAHGEGRRHGHPAPALGRDAHGPRRVPRDRRRHRQRRPPERQDRQGRPQAPHRRAAADARHRHEPGRPPARRRRGLDHPGRHPVTPWGVPTLGYRTRKKHKASDRYIVRGRRRGKKSKR